MQNKELQPVIMSYWLA